MRTQRIITRKGNILLIPYKARGAKKETILSYNAESVAAAIRKQSFVNQSGRGAYWDCILKRFLTYQDGQPNGHTTLDAI